MRPVQEMDMEFVNALNAAESECAKLRRMLEEEQKLVQRLEQEKEDEVQMANIKIERMSQQLAEARKDVEFATVRADVAENKWIKTKRGLQKERELLQLLKLEYDEIGQSAMRQVEEKELELANLLNSSEIAEIEWIKVKKELQEKLEHVQLLKQECQETRQSAMRQVEEKELEFADALNALNVAAAAAPSSAAAEGFAASATSVFATPTHSQSTPFGSSPLFGSSGNTTISSRSSMLPSSSVADVFNSASNTCSSHCSAMSSIFGFSSREKKSSSSFPFGVSSDFVSSASSLPLLVSSTASTVSSPILVSSTASAASNASSLKFGSSTSSVASTASSSKFSCSPAFIASCTSMPIIGSVSPSSSFSLGGSYSSGRKLVRVRKVKSKK
ncbi:hypothetical protein QN277_010233 [Acacia crassicarpa]|uniref:Uncharacterized protein n=1 Tax=Acacia crassicarpa TaxID=499986 RepID=A0AAE1JI25_9FABA|nr:hypothetical protein QN277_010233 [Acacia crassicarpa]